MILHSIMVAVHVASDGLLTGRTTPARWRMCQFSSATGLRSFVEYNILANVLEARCAAKIAQSCCGYEVSNQAIAIFSVNCTYQFYAFQSIRNIKNNVWQISLRAPHINALRGRVNENEKKTSDTQPRDRPKVTLNLEKNFISQ